MGPTPRVARARRLLADLPLPPGSRVLVACSGGPDSLALAATLARVGDERGWVTGAVVVDHGLREGTADEAAHVAEMCESLGLPARVMRVNVAGVGGPEAAARDARYAALDAAAGGAGAALHSDDATVLAAPPHSGHHEVAPAHVLLGHTLDDQAETVLLGLARGSGARSIAGMAPVSGRYIRPFLPLTREDTEGICADLGLTPVVDPTNAPDGPWRRADGGPLRRSAVRHGALPALVDALGPGVVHALARTADLLRADADYLDDVAARAYETALVSDDHADPTEPEGGEREAGPGVETGGAPATNVTLDVAVLASLHPAVRTRVLHRAIMDQSGPGARGSVGRTHVDAVDRLVTHYQGQGPIDLPGKVSARRAAGRLHLSKGTGRGH